jgi:hypothetical protein
MDSFANSPFAALTIIGAPAILTNASALLCLGTSNRLARIVDRSRVLQYRLKAEPDTAGGVQDEVTKLAERARLVNRAIGMCTFGALLVCVVIVALFVSAFANAHLGEVIALAFTGAIVALIGALVTFLRETYLATRTLRSGSP